MRKLYLLMILVVAFGCGTPKESGIHIALTNNDSTLQITGIDSLILNDIARDTANHFNALVPVYRMPADTDMKDYQNPQPGKYFVNNGSLFFKPDTPFARGQSYFVRHYLYRKHNTIGDFLSGAKSARGVKHRDLIFRP